MFYADIYQFIIIFASVSTFYCSILLPDFGFWRCIFENLLQISIRYLLIIGKIFLYDYVYVLRNFQKYGSVFPKSVLCSHLVVTDIKSRPSQNFRVSSGRCTPFCIWMMKPYLVGKEKFNIKITCNLVLNFFWNT